MKTRTEILEHLKKKGIDTVEGKPLDDEELEKRLLLLKRSDVIEGGETSFRFKGISDVVFNQVFQLIYSEEIDHVRKEETLAIIRQQNEEERKKEVVEVFQKNKGCFLEFIRRKK